MKEKDRGWEPLLCGGVAGLINRFCISPLDVVKIRLQLQSASSAAEGRLYDGAWHAFRTILKQEGVRGLWKGNVAAEWLYVTYSAAQFWSYGQISRAFDAVVAPAPAPAPATAAVAGSAAENGTKLGWHAPLWVKPFIAGAGAGAFATTATYPFDLLRTRYAAAAGNAPLLSPSTSTTSTTAAGADARAVGRRSVGLIAVVRDVVRREGLSGMYRGLAPSVAQIVPYMGLLFGTYEPLRKFLHTQLNPRLEALADDLVPAATSLNADADADADAEIDAAERARRRQREAELRRYFVGWDTALAGVVAGLLSKTGTFPLDVARKRLQVQGHGLGEVYVFKDIPVYGAGASTTSTAAAAATAATTSDSRDGGTIAKPRGVTVGGYLSRSTTVGCIVQIVRREGFRGLYKGLGVSLVKSAPSSAITLFTFEQTARLLRRVRGDAADDEGDVDLPAA